jgi:hypothetical protein
MVPASLVAPGPTYLYLVDILVLRLIIVIPERKSVVFVEENCRAQTNLPPCCGHVGATTIVINPRRKICGIRRRKLYAENLVSAGGTVVVAVVAV